MTVKIFDKVLYTTELIQQYFTKLCILRIIIPLLTQLVLFFSLLQVLETLVVTLLLNLVVIPPGCSSALDEEHGSCPEWRKVGNLLTNMQTDDLHL